MLSFRTTSLLEQEDIVLRQGRLGVLCDASAWNPENGEYTFESLARRGRLAKIFIPNTRFTNDGDNRYYGYSDDILDNTSSEEKIRHNLTGLVTMDVPIVFPEKGNRTGVSFRKEEFEDIDALIIDIQDAGARYSSAAILLYELFYSLKDSDLPIYIIDKLNPAGRQIEGSGYRFGEEGESKTSSKKKKLLENERKKIAFPEGLPHRHGLTFGELAYFVQNEFDAKFPLHIISSLAPSARKSLIPLSIPSFSNPGNFISASMMTGTFLWSATNVSNGVGTVLPYEIFGAPFLDSLSKLSERLDEWSDCPFSDDGVYMRWTSFIPEHSIHAGRLCYGFQFIPNPNFPYHSLAHNLKLINFIRHHFPDFQTERENGLLTLKELIGDSTLYAYTQGEIDYPEIREYIKTEEQKWIRKAKKFSLYEDAVYRIK